MTDFYGVLLDTPAAVVGWVTKKVPKKLYGTLLRIRTGPPTTSLALPYLSQLVPASGALDVDRTTNIVFTIASPPCGVPIASIVVEISINGGAFQVAFEDAEFQTGFDGELSLVTGVTAGYQFTIDPALPFTAGDVVRVRVNATNVLSVAMPEETYLFYVFDSAGDDDPVPTDFGADRQAEEYTIRDPRQGRVRVQVIDRIGVDDVVRHLVDREVYRLAGGTDPGVEMGVRVVDFLVREKLVRK